MSWRDTLVGEKVSRADENFGLGEVRLPRGSRHMRHKSVDNEVAARVKRGCRVEELSEKFATDPVTTQARIDFEVNRSAANLCNRVELRDR